MRRREFLINTKTALGIGIIAQAIESCSSQSVTPKPTANFTLDLTNPANSALSKVGGVLLTNGIYVVCTAQSTYIALSPICTHAGCTVSYSSSQNEFICPCHGGTYNISGKVISGPPPSPLAQYQVTVSGNTLTISG